MSDLLHICNLRDGHRKPMGSNWADPWCQRPFWTPSCRRDFHCLPPLPTIHASQCLSRAPAGRSSLQMSDRSLVYIPQYPTPIPRVPNAGKTAPIAQTSQAKHYVTWEVTLEVMQAFHRPIPNHPGAGSTPAGTLTFAEANRCVGDTASCCGQKKFHTKVRRHFCKLKIFSTDSLALKWQNWQRECHMKYGIPVELTYSIPYTKDITYAYRY